jgi:SecD/SecF fusion protein
MSRHLGWRLLLVLSVVAGSVLLVVTRPARLGLDLRGGTQIVLEARPKAGVKLDRDTLDRTVEVLRRRIDQLGVSEPTLQRSGDSRVIVELPGVSDPDEALKVIGRTAQLTFHPVVAEKDAEAGAQDEDGEQLPLGPDVISGDSISDARATFMEAPPGWSVEVTFRGVGSRRFEELTAQAACAPPQDPQRRVAIVLDDEIISSPQVDPSVACDEGISGGTTVITGDFSQDEARDLALLIRAGALPVPVDVVEQRTVGPTLGRAAIEASFQAALIGGLLTILYMIVYYRLFGALAAVALLTYGLVSFAVLLALRATLTLPGIAGFVLAVGMAVDANVLVFERAKDEFAAGRPLRSAAQRGFTRAWTAIADSNATTLIAAFLLYWFAAGAVRGFGVTLAVGVLVSMFSALVITRVLVDVIMRSPRSAAWSRGFGMAVGGRVRVWIAEKRVDIVGHRRVWYAVSALALALAVGGIVVRGFNYGVEFTGGQLVEYETTKTVDPNDLRRELASEGFARAVVQRSGKDHIAIRLGKLSSADEDTVAGAVRDLGGRAERVRSEFIGPTIGEELRKRALIALGAALLVQLAYLAMRFRWTYGASAVMAMFHDLVLLVGVFAWLGKSIDGVFLASVLTVIGYSINDSVVVFDRIREERRMRPREALSAVANDACLQTVPRTINTGLGAIFILVALYFLGGETLTDFALALLIGIGVGTYSSVFTAAPLLVSMERDGRSGRPARPQRPGERARGRASGTRGRR